MIQTLAWVGAAFLIGFYALGAAGSPRKALIGQWCGLAGNIAWSAVALYSVLVEPVALPSLLAMGLVFAVVNVVGIRQWHKAVRATRPPGP